MRPRSQPAAPRRHAKGSGIHDMNNFGIACVTTDEYALANYLQMARLLWATLGCKGRRTEASVRSWDSETDGEADFDHARTHTQAHQTLALAGRRGMFSESVERLVLNHQD
ncbi:hypothetical protein Cob_v012290 [Colletotrichum orbiculare MAFF 240422]|uniref:Uncharacterized protein n=1 Tax=Colletotrichum orbiculare (strain 104-T / ATCC 96160 / CBS 514.97 / LARS 414 / MAFF 240422) TaxID=1213857 RepID=A0A484F8X3_COLOR|nr:hypothetical protein Cob_v012290 [Colletotrichum orbiculare MAFF 240422]